MKRRSPSKKKMKSSCDRAKAPTIPSQIVGTNRIIRGMWDPARRQPGIILAFFSIISHHCMFAWIIMSLVLPLGKPRDSCISKTIIPRLDVNIGAHTLELEPGFLNMPVLDAHGIDTTGNSHSSVCAKTHRKMRIPSENIFLTVYSQKNTHENIMTEKFICSVCSPSETIFLWVLHAHKNCVWPD